MCGICGIVNIDGSSVSDLKIGAMMEKMKRRGPDDEGVFIEDNVGLGFVRLSILDLTQAGHQPMISDDGRYILTFNGEIYNYIELRNQLKQKGYAFKSSTDTEVLLYSYIEWGEDCLDRFNGMFAFVIYDTVDKTLFGARDRYGIKPFYYVATDKHFIYASDIPPLLASGLVVPAPNDSTIFDYLVYNRTNHNAQTFFEGILKLRPGTKLKLNGKTGQMKTEKWYSLQEKIDSQNSSPTFSFRESFFQAVRLQLRTDVPLGTCLSGGLDSSAITSAVLMCQPEMDLHSFSAIYGKGKVGDESEFINLLNDKRLNMHFTYPTMESLINDLDKFTDALSEPVPNTSEYAEYKVMELAKQYCTVILNGQGADEIMAGYHYFYGYFFKDLLTNARYNTFFAEILAYYRLHKSFFGIKALFFAFLPSIINQFDYGQLSPNFSNRFKSAKNPILTKFYETNTLQEFLIKHFEYKFEHNLLWADKSGMYFSLETRFPFLDHHLVEATLAKKITIEKGYTKALMRNELVGVLPEKVRMRTDKVGFSTPEDEWFKTPQMKTVVMDILTSEKFAKRGYFSQKECLSYYENFLKGKGNAAKIWKWVNLELWFNKYID
jgi:asparagine synthase (glutamine-hydrolysing)